MALPLPTNITTASSNHVAIHNDIHAVVNTVVVDSVGTFAQEGTLVAGTGVSRFRFPFAASLAGVSAAVGTAPTGSSILLNVRKNGTTLFSGAERPEILAAANATTAEMVPASAAIVVGDYLTVDIDQIGTTAAGSDLTVFIRYRR